MAVGMMIGSAFTGIVNSVVKDLFTPIIAMLTGSVDFSALAIVLGEGENAPVIAIGNFIQTVINFFILALVVLGVSRKVQAPAQRTAPKEAVLVF